MSVTRNWRTASHLRVQYQQTSQRQIDDYFVDLLENPKNKKEIVWDNHFKEL